MEDASLPLDAYLDRIGLSGRPGLAEVHRAHVASIPFENLDPHRGVPVQLDPEALERKLVGDRRGGYCFEQNLVLAAGLRSLGARVDLLLGRVRLGRPSTRTSPRTHLVLRVEFEGATWLADAGFGNGTLQEPIPFGPGGTHDQSGWRFRIVQEGPEHVLQVQAQAGWTDLYGFVPEPVPPVDIETSNWFTCTHPRSPFVTGLLISLQQPDGTRICLTDWGELTLTVQTPERLETTRPPREQIPDLLAEHFQLPGFTLDADGRVALAAGRGRA
jgi:N-hydroxyarylamine O-acetyltransferase